jgi:23S rRNA (guanosine2251-2'-O)-methyltransferase
MITLYGRNAVLEALKDSSLDCRTLHLASSNRPGGTLTELRDAARRRGVRERSHSREALARISRNGRQDQGVALDVHCPQLREFETVLASSDDDKRRCHLIALDGVTNPQNLGMAIRSATAAGIDGILHADRGNPALGPLVIKASAGTVFRAPLLRCPDIAHAAQTLQQNGFTIYRLQAGATLDLQTAQPFARRALFVLGGETDGISDAVRQLPGEDLAIPMANGVESLNVAVSAALVAYADHLCGPGPSVPGP